MASISTVAQLQSVFQYPGLENIHLEPHQVVLMGPSDPNMPGRTNSEQMILSMIVTYLVHHGSPIPASGLAEINRMGIFVLWGIEEELGKLCEKGLSEEALFNRYRVAGELEEYLVPTKRFEDLLRSKISNGEYQIFG